MIPQLVQQLASAPGGSGAAAQATVLTSDPLDLICRMEQVWSVANLLGGAPVVAGPRKALYDLGAFASVAIPPTAPWDHLMYAFAIENTRAPQILARVVHGFRSGEGLGIPSAATQRWLDTTEALLLGAGFPISAWLSTSAVRPGAEAVRRNAYYRMFGMDLAFGTDQNTPFVYDKAEASNRNFVPLFEELLFELWRAIENIRNQVAGNTTDDDRIYRLAEQLGYMLHSRRLNNVMVREELAAVTAMGWVEQSLASDTPVVVDLRAQASSASERLRIVGERVKLAPHSRASSFFGMATELSLLMRALEGDWVKDAGNAWLLYHSTVPPGVTPVAGTVPLGTEVRRIITEWAAASGRDLKQRAVPVKMASPPALAGRSR